MKNVVVEVTSVKHGAEVIQAFKDLGVDTRYIEGRQIGWYYGLFEGKFNFMPKPHNSQVITLEQLKAMANPYPKMMWVWDNSEEDAQKREVISEIQSNGIKYYITHIIGDALPAFWKHAKDIEEPIEMKTPMQELIDSLKEYRESINQYETVIIATLDTCIANAKAMLEKEKEVMCQFAYKCHKRHKVYGDFMIQDYFNQTFNTKEK